MLLFESTQDPEIVCAEFQIRLLDQIINGLPRPITHPARYPKGNRCYSPVESADELLPRFRVAAHRASTYQFLNRYGGIASHSLLLQLSSAHILQGFTVLSKWLFKVCRTDLRADDVGIGCLTLGTQFAIDCATSWPQLHEISAKYLLRTLQDFPLGFRY
jgi:hypothetical protein